MADKLVEEAKRRIAEAASITVRAARKWDGAVFDLAKAWKDMVVADGIMRQNRKAAGTENDSGRMEARLLHPRAMFALALAMSEVGFHFGFPVHRESGMPAKLADYVGSDPETDYGVVAEAQATKLPKAKSKRRKYRRRKGAQSPEAKVEEAFQEAVGA
jgi:hypothetical protein